MLKTFPSHLPSENLSIPHHCLTLQFLLFYLLLFCTQENEIFFWIQNINNFCSWYRAKLSSKKSSFLKSFITDTLKSCFCGACLFYFCSWLSDIHWIDFHILCLGFAHQVLTYSPLQCNTNEGQCIWKTVKGQSVLVSFFVYSFVISVKLWRR